MVKNYLSLTRSASLRLKFQTVSTQYTVRTFINVHGKPTRNECRAPNQNHCSRIVLQQRRYEMVFVLFLLVAIFFCFLLGYFGLFPKREYVIMSAFELNSKQELRRLLNSANHFVSAHSQTTTKDDVDVEL